MAYHNELGKWGENVAADYLQRQGYTILYRDWKCGHRDIDIVAVMGETLIIVEVKTRRNEVFTDADTAVDAQKIKSLSIAANAFIKRYGGAYDVRFDIITVLGTPESEPKINHIIDAFLPFI
ncbi:MAG: YraN family protein [Prevotella bivia]|jgi:hypothetical protein|uniref:UPF0102 protein PrebiDRAFT_2176 n=3 Tax=Prevotella bivia TaxID=28125 RepID=I4ZC86_9BACT|nr:YraN family protein [Prevotella bivia]EFB93409.1 hypothetical protein HMPREF0648_1964 [Prevotella bivia JCVIHMP010]EIM33828.1 putative endonuclease related to Holliday junction resolvase [Prevotella bivia DSM 20514]KGF22526.1 hypothetical protein HMPREF1651_04650 [Prevotella bivia DNF00188]KGF38261.1 hypothetical protein HMPREF2136_03620 [Prevotella bivia DNF00650]KGF44079.1 hypothetical protein HMPREF0647_08115 [Prevotella bivia DNF00320]